MHNSASPLALRHRHISHRSLHDIRVLIIIVRLTLDHLLDVQPHTPPHILRRAHRPEPINRRIQIRLVAHRARAAMVAEQLRDHPGALVHLVPVAALAPRAQHDVEGGVELPQAEVVQ